MALKCIFGHLVQKYKRDHSKKRFYISLDDFFMEFMTKQYQDEDVVKEKCEELFVGVRKNAPCNHFALFIFILSDDDRIQMFGNLMGITKEFEKPLPPEALLYYIKLIHSSGELFEEIFAYKPHYKLTLNDALSKIYE
jgi:hypothetical protein